ncbi:MAG: tol-pal system protein YbgF [Gammaproteobacteria bacterium]|nr:tol-pal system protein YbgF [Gammaproteobacteria bacterium]
MNAITLRSFLIGVITVVLAPFAYGQIPIDESVGEITAVDQQEDTADPVDSAVNQSGQLFLQLQRLQGEVQMLRGIVEEQAAMLARLEQQRFDDFVAIDQRIAALEAGGVVVTTPAEDRGEATDSSVASTDGVVVPDTLDSAASDVDEERAKAEYDRAREQLMSRNFDQAVEQFNQFVVQYPSSRYAANAYYWLGEIAIQRNDLQQARQQFTSVINFFPNHHKTQDAKYKLGVIYYQLGQAEQSRSYFEEAASGTGNTARLARAKLDEYF